ncbi:MAG: hypothetical protein ACQERC_05505 [Bacteroidota bacterium]
METYLAKAKHNEKFHDDICDQFNDRYFDWKITSLFYSAIHLVKVLAEKDSKNIGFSHSEVNSSINPHNSSAELPISRGAYAYYISLYKQSKTARYDGIDTDPETFELLKKNDWEECKEQYLRFRKYMKNKRSLNL